jgi:glycosyltransferase involved in cell wall biosynthesis
MTEGARPTSLHVAHVIRSVASKYGGPAVTVPALCQELSLAGQDVSLHVADGQAPLAPLGNARFFGHSCVPGGARFGVSLQLHRALVEESRSADIVHSHGLWLFPNLDVHWATRRGRSKLVLSPRGMLEKYALDRSAAAKRLVWALGQGAAARAADCIHVTSESEYHSIREVGLDNPVAVVPNGVFIPQAAARAEGPRRRLLFLGRIDPKKGVDLLLRAWTAVSAAYPAWDLDIVGPGDAAYVEEMRGLASSLEAQRVTFAEAVFGAERDRLLATADLFVLPTRSENFGMTVAEALASGVPVICSRGAPWSGIEDERCGDWIDIGVEPLVHALRAALARPREELGAMGARGRAWMERDFGWAAQANKLIATYRWLLGQGPAPAYVRLD